MYVAQTYDGGVAPSHTGLLDFLGITSPSPSPPAYSPILPSFTGPPTFAPGPGITPTGPPVFQSSKTECSGCGVTPESVHDQLTATIPGATVPAVSTECQVCYGTFCAKCFFFWLFAVIFVLLLWRGR